MSDYSPTELAERVKTLSIDEAHGFWETAGSPHAERLTPEHARELLAATRGMSEWYRIMAVLQIGDFYFENEFVDYAIDMLTFPPSGYPAHDELWAHLAKKDDPWAVSLWASNLLVSRKTISPEQYRRISELPDNTFHKQELLDALKPRVA
ncbi:MAG: hypothetical protein LC135_09660 [Phycisphaerae bacterium]|jgi:hypothetical protein|nr:hypothetical protein [Phycisphaerae bacterium]MCZ2400115.1 hypothetical protein [Phycisphaerae bacterium]